MLCLLQEHTHIVTKKLSFNSLVPGSPLDLDVAGDSREEEGGETDPLHHNIGGEVADGELPIADDGLHIWLRVHLHLDHYPEGGGFNGDHLDERKITRVIYKFLYPYHIIHTKPCAHIYNDLYP
jgi:hypothetical protein